MIDIMVIMVIPNKYDNVIFIFENMMIDINNNVMKTKISLLLIDFKYE